MRAALMDRSSFRFSEPPEVVNYLSPEPSHTSSWKYRDVSLRCGAAWIIGWLVYMVAMALTVYDGFLSIVFQPIIGAVVSALTVFMCLVFGLPLQLPLLKSVWNRWPWIDTAFLVIGVFSMIPGQLIAQTNPKTHETFYVVGDAAIVGYIMVLFAIVNFPHVGKT